MRKILALYWRLVTTEYLVDEYQNDVKTINRGRLGWTPERHKVPAAERRMARYLVPEMRRRNLIR